MNLFEHVTKINSSESTADLIGIIAIILFFIVIILKMLGGIRRGFWHQLLLTGTTVLCAVVSCSVAIIFTRSVVDFVSDFILDGTILATERCPPVFAEIFKSMISAFDPASIEKMILIPATFLVAPIVTVCIFFILRFIFRIFISILQKVIKLKKAKSTHSRLGGALLAAIDAIVCLIVITLPLTGIISLANMACES